jgi:hypothetical protein
VIFSPQISMHTPFVQLPLQKLAFKTIFSSALLREMSRFKASITRYEPFIWQELPTHTQTSITTKPPEI